MVPRLSGFLFKTGEKINTAELDDISVNTLLCWSPHSQFCVLVLIHWHGKSHGIEFKELKLDHEMLPQGMACNCPHLYILFISCGVPSGDRGMLNISQCAHGKIM